MELKKKYIPGLYILHALNQVSNEDSQFSYYLILIWVLKIPLISKSIQELLPSRAKPETGPSLPHILPVTPLFRRLQFDFKNPTKDCHESQTYQFYKTLRTISKALQN